MNKEQITRRIYQHLEFIYGADRAAVLEKQLEEKIVQFREFYPLGEKAFEKERFSERDAIVITYADQVHQPGKSPLATLREFLLSYMGDALSGVHLLPFYPYSSDDGFSVIDYRQVDPNVGTWADVSSLGEHYRIMFDAVINHTSQHSAWFKGYLQGEEPYKNYFIEVPPETDLTKVVRPRALPLLTPVETSRGTRHVWTTFSTDQIDLNFAEPKVLLEVIDLLLFYVSQGAEIIRLDAIAFMWKELGTSCIHLPETHHAIKLFRAVLDAAAPQVTLITETNVPHEENVSYFGDGYDEAQMVYQFPLAPLVLHTFQAGDVRVLSEWVSSLETPSLATTFFNFIASHDGIGVRPVERLLTQREVQALVESTLKHGGEVSYKNNPDGSRSVYELNITLYDALNNPHQPDLDLDVARFLASQTIMLSLAGVPGIYFHSLVGSRNCEDCKRETSRARSINREKFSRVELESRLEDPISRPTKVLQGYLSLLKKRQTLRSFHPNVPQRVLDLGEKVFSLVRGTPGEADQLLCLVNVTVERIHLEIDLAAHSLPVKGQWQDLISDAETSSHNGVLIANLGNYQVMWLVGLND